MGASPCVVTVSDMWHVRKINMCGNSVISKWLSVWHCDRVGDGLVVSVYKCNVMVQLSLYYLCNYLCIIAIFAWDTSQCNLGRLSGPCLYTLTPDSDPWLALTGNCRKNYSIVSIVFWFWQSHHHKLPWVFKRSFHQGHLHSIPVVIIVICSDSLIKKPSGNMNLRSESLSHDIWWSAASDWILETG